jgi:uncharacterized protein (TIGR03083 family)
VADLGQLVDDYEASIASFTAVLRSLPDGSTKVPHLEWTVADTAAHVLSSHRTYAPMVDGGPPVWDHILNGVESNARNMATVSEHAPADLATAIEETAAAVAARVRKASPGHEVRPWGPITVPIESAVGVWSGDVQVHGWDLSTVTGTRWVIPTDLARRCLGGVLDIAEHFVDTEAAAGFRGRFALHLGEGSVRTLDFDDGALTVTEGVDGKVDCHIRADPATFMLLGYGRIGQVKPALTGKLIPYGRKPWLALKFAKLLRNP